MPYKIVKSKIKSSKPYQIINKATKKVVGTSSSKAKAGRSIGYREKAIMKEEQAWRSKRKIVK